jgi:hypothetical protein
MPLLLFSLIAACERDAPDTAADIMLTNGYIYTVDEERSIADSIAISGNRIVAIGDRRSVAVHAGPDTIVRDLNGRMVLPGLHDMHIHALGTVPPTLCDLGEQSYSLQELVAFLRGCLDTYAPAEGAWLPVLGWNSFEGNQPTEEYPTLLTALDAVSTEHPIVLWGYDGHHGAANSDALASPKVPINGETLASTYRDIRSLVETDRDGNPSGGIHEEARLLLRDMDHDFLGVSARSDWIMPRVAQNLARSGITSIQDPAVTQPILEHYLWLAGSDEMTFRLRAALRLDLYDPSTARVVRSPAEALHDAVALREKAAGQRYVAADAVKIFADSVLEGNPYTTPPTLPKAAMLDGFRRPVFAADEASGDLDVVGYEVMEDGHRRHAGELVHEPKVLEDLVARATEDGFHVHVHTIADASARAVAAAFENAHGAAVARGLTQSVAHLQIARTEDVRRLGDLGAFVAFTYMWANPDPAYELVVVPFIDEIDGAADLYNPRHYYMRNAYPFRTALRSGAVPVFGSDVPVGSREPRPFQNMQAALTRERGGIVLNTGETLGIDETIAAFTINGARLMTHDDELGSLETGKIADLVVIDRNIVELAAKGDAAAIGQTRVLLTMFDGRIIFEAE